MKIEIIDGKNTIGGNKILIRDKSDSFFLDFGKNFKSWGNYFEEFLQPRTSVGIFDLWRLNLIPKFSNIYRDDLILSEFRSIVDKEEGLDLSAVFLSHAHLDHSGFISVLKEDVPIITSSITRKLLMAMQETGDRKVFSQYNAVKSRKESEDEFGQKKLEAKGKKDELIPIERNFLEINNDEFEGEINGIRFKTFAVDHSIPGAMSVFLEIGGKTIVYTGDIRFHGKNAQKSYNFVEKVKSLKPDILISEGTRAISSNKQSGIDNDIENGSLENEKPKTENDVYLASVEVVKKYSGKFVIADFGPRNVERLETFLKIAEETKRKVAITYKDAYLLHLLKDVGFNFIDSENLFIVAEKKAQERNWTKVVKEEYNSKIITMDNIAANSGDFILCYSFWDLINLFDVDIREGAYIYSSSEAYSEEQIIDMKRLLNWIEFLNLTPFGISLENGEISFSREYHSSGHASFSDLVYMIEEINPQFLIPVHTENSMLFAEKFKGREVKVVENEIFEL